jgi:hypothetical protein
MRVGVWELSMRGLRGVLGCWGVVERSEWRGWGIGGGEGK